MHSGRSYKYQKLKVAESGNTIYQLFVAAAGKARLTQRSRGFGSGVVVSKICYNAVIVLSVVLCDCCKPKNAYRDWVFSKSWLEVGAASLSAAHVGKMWLTAERSFALHVCLRHFPSGIPSIHYIPEAPPALHYFMLAKDPIPLSKIPGLSHVEEHGFGHGVVVSKVLYRILERVVVCHLPCYCNESRLCFSNGWWEVSLPAFQLPMFVKREEICSIWFDMLVQGFHAFCEI